MWAAARGLCCPGAGVLLRRGCGEAALHRTRSLHGSAVSCGSKNLLKKFASKTRKKFWYEGPSLGFTGPSKLDLLLKRTSKRTRKEDHVRLRALNGLLYKALTDLLSTPEVSQEVYNLNVELSKVSLTPDFSACRVYWKVSLSADQNKRTEATLQRSAAHMRHLLMSQQTLRNVPPIVFIQDRKNAALAEIDGLLAVAEFGPPDEGDHPLGDDPRDPDALSPHDAPGPASCSSLCGIDHEALSKQIMEYKRRKERGLLSLALRGQEQGAEPTQLVRRRRRKTLSCQDKISSPKSFLLGEDEDEDKDYTLGCECQTHEAEQEWGADSGDEGAEQGPCGRTGQGQG
ncbi:ribosome binding factor A (putative), transcript variant X1 [Ictidomys tridecemlineatus]|uniref:Ribosome binding factor A n=1 Tax=Ictidomys tridecemlineatus TaxID=43179 RepID=I3MF90_ICTTR|nr:putative ribosome-binding factor A, mitochondrial [Ictidomys tridecemlineatus]KAG3293667.1 ribosome binding factor A (putative), transcript variant X1 [Ictidomys tridecemlineatus]